MTGKPPIETTARARQSQRPTRIQTQKREVIMEAALDVFSAHGFRGATVEQIAARAGMSKANLLYYFSSKEEMHVALLNGLLESWLEPLRALDPEGDPLEEIRAYIRRKLQMARDNPRESRLFASEIIQGAPRIGGYLSGPLRELVTKETVILRRWAEEGRIADTDPHHLIFSIWATTQHYADFDAQVRALLPGDAQDDRHFEDAAAFLEALYTRGLSPPS